MIEKVSYAGWPNCYRLADDKIELIATGDVGTRIVRLRIVGSDNIFLKCFDHYVDVLYPDNGCSVESYTNNRFLELETLGPMEVLEPGDSAIHVERWYIFEGIRCDLGDEDTIEQVLGPLVAQSG